MSLEEQQWRAVLKEKLDEILKNQVEILQKLGGQESAIDNLFRAVDKLLIAQQKTDKSITAPSSQVKPAADKTVKINNTEVPATIQELADIREGDGLYILTKPWTPYKDDWVTINNFVKGIGGKWVRAGKDSRWEIQKKP
jgi:hypothetical protein